MSLRHPPAPSISTLKHKAFLTPESTSSTPTSGRYSSKCSYLDWQLNIDPSTLCDFESQVRRDFANPGPYPPIVLPQPSSSHFHTSASSSMSIPSFGHCTSLLKPTQPAIVPSPLVCYPTPSTPDTPSCSHSTSTSPCCPPRLPLHRTCRTLMSRSPRLQAP